MPRQGADEQMPRPPTHAEKSVASHLRTRSGYQAHIVSGKVNLPHLCSVNRNVPASCLAFLASRSSTAFADSNAGV